MPYTFKHGDRPLDDFTIQRAVGAGGFGEVYYALSDGGREVALKYLKSNPHIELRGVSHCINLKSPHLVSIFDVRKSADGEYFIVMEYCSGPSLRDLLIAEPKGFAPEKAAFFVREIAKGLAYLHDRGIVHRDLKPGNIFFDDGYVKIGDYGLSKFISISRHSAQTSSVGTVHYMAPEIGSGHYSRGVDIYALGVMLYEMILGRVPFEGSTMGEVLMKHLTQQAELDHLPAPFGRVIRKAMEKDPKDRYQTVDEMVDDLLAVEDVRRSVAGFSTRSLEGAVHRGGADGAASPVPSPNPTPRPYAGPRRPFAGAAQDQEPWDSAKAPPLPPKLAKKLDTRARKIEKKLAKLAGRGERIAPPFASPKPPGKSRPRPAPPLPGSSLGKRIVLTVLLMVGLSVALGVICGVSFGLERGFAAGLMSIGLSGGLLLSRGSISWFGADLGPTWAERLVRIACTAPLMALGALPMFATTPRPGFALWLGLTAIAMFARWEKAAEESVTGEISFGAVFKAALGALVLTAMSSPMLGVGPQKIMWMAAGIAAIASVVTQASAWWRGPRLISPQPANVEGETSPTAPAPSESSPYGVVIAMAGEEATPQSTPQVDSTTSSKPLVDPNAARQRWGVTRMFWGVIAFVTMGGAIILLLMPFILNEMNHDDVTGTIIGCIACGSVMLFGLRKTTPTRQPGFWREWLRPFLRMVGMFGLGALITASIRHWPEYGDEERVLSVIGLVFSSLILVLSLVPTSKRAATPAPFLRQMDRGPVPAASTDAQ